MGPQRPMRPEHVTGMIVGLSGLAGTSAMFPMLKTHPFAFSLSAAATLSNIVLWTHTVYSPVQTHLAPLGVHRGVLGIASWLLQLVLGVMVLAGAIPLPDPVLRLYKQGYAFYVQLFFSVSDQLHARQVLHERWVLAIAEAHVLMVWAVYFKYAPEIGWFMPMVWHHLAIVVLPYLFHHHHNALSKLVYIMTASLFTLADHSQQLLLGRRSTLPAPPAPSSLGKCQAAGSSKCTDSWEHPGGDVHEDEAMNKLDSVADTAAAGDKHTDNVQQPVVAAERAGTARPTMALGCTHRLKQVSAAGSTAAHTTSMAGAAGMLDGNKSSLLDSQASLTAAAHMVQSPMRAYVSPLGMHTQVAFKVVSFDEPEDVPAGAALQLQGAMQDAASGTGYGLQVEVLRVSMRRGCLLIAADLFITGAGTAATPSRGSSDGTCVLDAGAVMAVARQLLPSLLTRLGLRSTDAHSSHEQLLRALMPGTSITMQLAHTVVRATWRGTTAGWGMEAVPNPVQTTRLMPGAVALPKLGVVTPHVWPVALDASQLDSCRSGSAHSGSGGQQDSCSRGTWKVLLSLQLFGLPEGAHVVGSTPDMVPGKPAGSMDTSDAAVSNSVDGAETMQLWVHGSVGHLPVRVLGPPATAPASGAGTLQVEVEVTRAALWCHHAGARPMQLQPLNLELWAGQHYLADTTQLLLSPHQLPGLEAGTSSPGGSTWWGTPATVKGAACEVEAVREVHAWLAQQLQQEGGQQDEVDPEQAFALQSLVRDITQWLVGVQHAAYTCGHCVSRPCSAAAAAAARGTPQFDAGRLHAWLPLPATKLQQLGQHLVAFSKAAGLVHLHQLVSLQQGLLRRQQLSSPSVHRHMPAGRQDDHDDGCTLAGAADCPVLRLFVTAWQNVCAGVSWLHVRLAHSLVGFSCKSCEQAYRCRMGGYLQPARVYCSLALGVMGLLSVCKMAPDAALFNMCTTSVYSSLHVLVGCWPHGGNSKAAQRSWSRRASRLLLLAMLVRMMGTASLTLKLAPMPHMVRRQYADGTWLVGYPLPEIMEQAGARALLPAAAVAGLALTGSVLHACNLMAVSERVPAPDAHTPPAGLAQAVPASSTSAGFSVWTWLRISCSLLLGMSVALLLPLLLDAWLRARLLLLRPAVSGSMMLPAAACSAGGDMAGAGPQGLKGLSTLASQKVA